MAESISSASPRTRPQAALNAGELGGRPSRPHVICDLSLLFISFLAAFFEGHGIHQVLLAWPLMGNREANYSMVKLSVYNNLPAERGEARGDNLAHHRGSVLPPGPQLI